MNKILSTREALLYALVFILFASGIVYLSVMKEAETTVTYYYQHDIEINDPSTVRIGVLASLGDDQVNDEWSDTMTYLTTQIDGHSFQVVPLDYDEVEQSLQDETIDFIFVNPAMFVEYEMRYGVTGVTSIVRQLDTTTTSSIGSVLITDSDSEIFSTSDLFDIEFAAVDESSFGGWLAMYKELMDEDIDPFQSFTSVTFTGTHQAVVQGVLNGNYDVGTIRTGVLEQLIEDGDIEEGDIRVVHRNNVPGFYAVSSRLYPEWTLAKTNHISDELSHDVAVALMALDNTDQAAISMSLSGWTTPRNYTDVHTTLRLLRAAPYENFGELSFRDTIYQNRMFLVIILVATFIIVSITLWFFHTRTELINMSKRSREMEEAANKANEAKGEFLANMSHEIRTPMGAVVGLATLMDSTELTPRQREYNNRLKSSAESLLGIINNILDYSKIEAKQMSLENIEFDLNDILYNLSNVVTLKALEKGIEFLFNIQSNLPGKFHGDPLRLGQVLINICTNAIKFTEEGQVVLIIKSTVVEDQFRLQFVIKDSGIGMSREQIEKITKPFTQADSSFTRKYGGTGLGLTITNQLIQIMGGRLHISSVINVGSTFSFSLPLKPISDPLQKDLLPTLIGSLRVLIIDDNTVSLNILGDICESLGFVTKKASTPDDVRKIITKFNFYPDLFIIDYMMPIQNGIELVQDLRKEKLMGDAKTLLMISVYDSEEVVQRAYDAGIKDFLDKPVNPSFLYDSLLSMYSNTEIRKVAEVENPHKIDLVKRGTPVIVAEDNPINQQIVNELLTKEGFHVTIANDGQEVLDLLREDAFDYELILMDIQMPRLNGREATRRIRLSDSKYRYIPIVAMTAHALEEERKKCMKVGMNDFLTKPVNMKKLFEVISKYVDIITVDTSTSESGTVEIDFLNSEEAIDNMAGNAIFYLDVLYTFYTDYKDFDKGLQAMFKDEDIDDIIIEVHTIKGLGATIGSQQLFEDAKALEMKLRDGNLDVDCFNKFIKTLQFTLDNLEEYFEANPFKKV